MTLPHSLRAGLDTVRVGAASLALLAAACSPQAAPAATTEPDATSLAGSEGSTCPDDGPRFAITQLCTGRISNYLDPAIGLSQETPEGCTWKFTETPMPDPNEVIIYRALECKGVMTALEVHGGAHSAGLGYTKSALFGDTVGDVEPVRLFTSDPADPQKVIRDMLEGVPAAERPKCEVRKAGIDGWPSDALVLAYSDAERKKMPKDEPISMCGEFGQDEDATTFWRIGGGYAWFFDLGQETSDINPGSFMIFRKGADGAWTHIE